MSTLTLGLWQRNEHGMGRSFVLSALVHVVLAAVLVLGVRWQVSAPDVVEVDLVAAPPPPPPVVEAPKPPPKVEPPPEVKPEPRVEKPQIVIPEKAKPKPKPKVEPKKPEPPAPEPEPEPEPEAPPLPSVFQDVKPVRKAKIKYPPEAEAQHNLGLLYDHGRGLSKDKG